MTTNDDSQKAYANAVAVKTSHEQELMAKANVVGVGVGVQLQHGEPTGMIAIVVLVDHKVPLNQLAPDDRIPKFLGGVPVDVQAIGRPEAQ